MLIFAQSIIVVIITNDSTQRHTMVDYALSLSLPLLFHADIAAISCRSLLDTPCRYIILPRLLFTKADTGR